MTRQFHPSHAQIRAAPNYMHSRTAVNIQAGVAAGSRGNILLEMRRFLETGTLWVALLPQAAGAATPHAAELGDAASMHGRYSTLTRCTGAPAQPWSSVPGFAAAAIASGWIGRRRTPTSD